MIQTHMEEFNAVMSTISVEPFKAPASMQESIESGVKPSPMLEAKMNIKKKVSEKETCKKNSKKELKEAAEEVLGLYNKYITEGAFARLAHEVPEHQEIVKAIQSGLCEAAAKAQALI